MGRLDEIQTQFVIIEREQLALLKKIASQLYREERLNGDQMRDMGHTITGVIDGALPFVDTEAADTSEKQLRAHLRELMLLVGNVAAAGQLALGSSDSWFGAVMQRHEFGAVITIAEKRMQDIRKENNL